MTNQIAVKACPECGRQNLYANTTRSGGGYGPVLLPKLGSFWKFFASFEVVVCADCGLTRFYAEPSARTKLPTTKAWRRL
jgi:predicted nucleic-acid-binding Zn-ribbon protein